MTNNIEIKAYTQQCICNHSRLSAGYASYTNRYKQAEEKRQRQNDNEIFAA